MQQNLDLLALGTSCKYKEFQTLYSVFVITAVMIYDITKLELGKFWHPSLDLCMSFFLPISAFNYCVTIIT